VDYQRLILENLALIDSVVSFIARRHHLTPDEADDLGSAIRLKLVDNDYFVLRKFEARSNLRTYLTTVIQRHFLDTRIAIWGRWRPSAQARRLGPVAVLLDQLVNRDGLSFNEAAEAILARPGVTMDKDDLQTIVRQLPHRVRRQFVGAEELERLPMTSPSEVELVDAIDRPNAGERIEDALRAALAQLGAQDRLILKMRFQDDFKIARIAEILNIPQKPLYRRIEDVMRVLRRELERRGVSQQEVASIIGQPDTSVVVPLSVESRGKVRNGLSVL
jgi:RNA polymerase sigma factor (sigma-70 family)